MPTPPDRHLIALGVSLALGLLVGLQRERADSAIAGFRTFALITVLGTVCAMIGEALGGGGGAGGWVMAGGLLAIACATGVGNFMRTREAGAGSPGITTEVAALLMFAIGAMLWLMPLHVGVALGVTVAVLLHLKDRLHAFAGRLTEHDMRAIMQFAAVTFVVLPLLPDQAYGPLQVLNPRHIWWMVALVVSISLAGYVALKVAGAHAGLILAGLIGGLVSSTATTVSYARRAGENPAAAPAALLAVLLAQCVLFGRVLIEIFVVARERAWALAPPLVMLGGVSVVTTVVVYMWSKRSTGVLPEPANPSELKGALWFAALYAVVLFGVAAAREFLGERGVLAVAAISGITDMDAITISSARLAAAGTLETGTAWRSIVLALISNTLFKLVLTRVLGGAAMFKLAVWPAAIGVLAGVLVLLFYV